ncbi:unnamed protein product, partial [Darwinula stevensoni]
VATVAVAVTRRRKRGRPGSTRPGINEGPALGSTQDSANSRRPRPPCHEVPHRGEFLSRLSCVIRWDADSLGWSDPEVRRVTTRFLFLQFLTFATMLVAALQEELVQTRAGNCPSPPLLGGYIGTSNCYPSSPIASCGSVSAYGVSAAEKDQIVYYFNYLRAWVASGRETRGSPGPQPTASNMRRMVWDERLAATAQGWANNCRFDHDRSECRNYGSTFSLSKLPPLRLHPSSRLFPRPPFQPPSKQRARTSPGVGGPGPRIGGRPS